MKIIFHNFVPKQEREDEVRDLRIEFRCSSGLCPAPFCGRDLRYVLYFGVVGKGQHGGGRSPDCVSLEVTRGGERFEALGLRGKASEMTDGQMSGIKGKNQGHEDKAL